MQFIFSDILFTLVLFLLLFISVYLFTSDKGKRAANILLGSFFFALCLNLADSFFLLKQIYFQHPAFALWGSNLLLLCGPLILLYTQAIIYKDFRFSKRKLAHFIPFLFFFIISETSYLAAGHDDQIKILRSIIDRKIPIPFYFVSSLIFIHFFFYLFLAKRTVDQYEMAASNQFAEKQKVTLNWMKLTIYFFLVLMVISVVNSFLSFQLMDRAYFIGLGITIFLLLLFIIFVLFKALRNPELFSGWEENEIAEVAHPVKYASSTMKLDEKKAVLENLQVYMMEKKPYLESELNLDDLSAQLNLKPKILSQVINELLHQNFFEFINSYRIEEAKRLLDHPKDKKITVLEVMYQVGFNSKSSFNTLFKKNTGVTPSEFKRSSLS